MILIAGMAWWSIEQYSPNSDDSRNDEEDSRKGLNDPALALPSGPRIAVLPFANLSNVQDQEYFSDGLTEDIITALSHTDLFVLGASSSFRYKAGEISVGEIRRELDVAYILKGSVRRDANTIRVSAQLLDAVTGGQLWGRSYDRDLSVSNIFAVQDDITVRVVGIIADASGIIARLGQEKLKRAPTSDLDAYECVLRSYAYEDKHTAEAHLIARDCLESALQLDSTYVDAMGILAYLYREEYTHSFNQRPNALERAVSLAHKAIELDPLNQNAHYALAFSYFEYGRSELEEFFNACRRAIDLNPNNARVIGGIGVLIALAGEWEWGLDLLEKMMMINPYSSLSSWLHFIKSSKNYHHGDYAAALAEINQVNFRIPIVHINIVAIHAQLGNQENARVALDDVLYDDHLFLENARTELEKFYLVDDDLVDLLMEGIDKAASDPDR